MSEDKITFDGPPSIEPATVPPPGTDPLKVLEDRRPTDAIADACLRLLRDGTPREDALMLALHHYASSLDETREQLHWYVERHSPVIKVRKDPP